MCVVNNFHMCCYAFHVYCYDFHELLCFACVLLCFPRVLLCFPCVVMLSICVMLSMFFRQIFWPFSPNHVAFPEKLMEWKSPHPLPNHRIPPFYQTSQSHPSAVLAPWNCWHLSAVSLLSFLSKQLIFFKFLLMGGILTAVNLWTQAQLVETLDCHSPHAIHCLATGLDGARPILCSGASDCRVSVRDAQDGLLLKMFKGHTKTVNAVQVRAVCSFLTIPPIAGTPVFSQSCGCGRRRSIMTQYTLHGLSSGVSKLFCQRATLLTEMRFVRGCYLQKSMLLNVTYRNVTYRNVTYRNQRATLLTYRNALCQRTTLLT